MVRGSPWRSTTNGGVERLNQTIEIKIGAWMKDNKTKHWSVGCKICCWRYNTQIHRVLGGKTPYHVTYGQVPRCGISTLPLDTVLLDTLYTETQLNDVVSRYGGHDGDEMLPVDVSNITDGAVPVP